MEDNFYVNLPSNVHTHKYFADNTIGNFTTKLPAHVSLDGKWEVGLVEMTYTKSWYNMPKKQSIELWYTINDNKGLSTVKKRGYIDKGNYNTIEDLKYAINVMAGKIDRDYKSAEVPQIELDLITRLVKIKSGLLDARRVFMLPNEELCQMLGFDYFKLSQYYIDVYNLYNFVELAKYKEKLTKEMLSLIAEEPKETPVRSGLKSIFTDDKHQTVTVETLEQRRTRVNNKLKIYKAEQPYDLSGGYHSLFVYCNIVKPSYVGNSFTQLLRLVEIPSDKKFGDQVLITYPSTYYIPLLTQEFETIEIDIKSETGETVPFEFGRSIITLHFRRKS